MNHELRTTTYQVGGMTCEHCTRAVTEEVSAIAGVSEVAVELDSGRLTVTGAGVERDAVAEAVDEAGYRLED
jgi:copper chaperone CopZ